MPYGHAKNAPTALKVMEKKLTKERRPFKLKIAVQGRNKREMVIRHQ